MKKLISILLILIFVFSTVITLANNSEDEILDILFTSNYLSGQVDATMVLKANAPLPKIIDNDGMQTKMLSNLKYKYDIKFNMSEDKKKMELEMDMNMIIPESDPMDIKYWIDLDFSNETEPVFKMIMKTPEDDRYMYMDYINTNGDSESIPNIENILDMDKINQINEEFINNIDKSKIITDYKDKRYKVVLDENTIKDLYKNLILSMSDIFSNIQTFNPITFNAGTNNNGLSNTDFEQTIIDFFDKIKNVQLFDKDAVVIEVEIDDDNLIKNQKMTINIKTNIAKVMQAFNAPSLIIPKEDSDIDISFIMDMNYSNVNEEVDIILPELTEDNSINMLEGMYDVYQQTFEINEDDINVIVNNQKVDFDVEPIMQDDEVLVPLRAFLNSININGNDIGYDNGVVTIKYGNDIIEFVIDSDIAYFNDKDFILDMPVIEIDGRTLLPANLIAEIFECDVFWTPFAGKENEIISTGILEFTSKR